MQKHRGLPEAAEEPQGRRPPRSLARARNAQVSPLCCLQIHQLQSRIIQAQKHSGGYSPTYLMKPAAQGVGCHCPQGARRCQPVPVARRPSRAVAGVGWAFGPACWA